MAFVSLQEYLDTTYRPDCDYVDGEVVERNTGLRDHSEVQGELLFFFRERRDMWGTHAYVALRLWVAPRRIRVPDICVFVGRDPTEQVPSEPPFICIELLSKDDTLESTQDRIDDYLKFGVPYIWLVNPLNRRAWVYTPDGSREVKDGTLRTENPEIVIPLADVFAGLD